MYNPLLFLSSTTGRPFRVIKPCPNKCAQRWPRACSAAAPTPSKEDIDKLFSRLKHINKNLQKKAGSEIAEFATEHEVDRLLQLLEVEDVSYRRAAVQTLGMTGLKAVPKLIQLLSDSPNSTIRASCAKALAAVALYFPEERATFPEQALTALQNALKVDSDPVTRLSVVGCLSTLGSDLVQRDAPNLSGCSRASEILFEVCSTSSDMAIGATAVSALAQIAQNGSLDAKKRVLRFLQSICDASESDDPESALRYVKEIARAHVDELTAKIARAAE